MKKCLPLFVACLIVLLPLQALADEIGSSSNSAAVTEPAVASEGSFEEVAQYEGEELSGQQSDDEITGEGASVFLEHEGGDEALASSSVCEQDDAVEVASDISDSCVISAQSSDNSTEPEAEEGNHSAISEGTYVIRSANAERQVLDVTAKSKNDGANVETWSSNAGDNQKWEVSAAGEGTYTLRSVLSGKYLDVKNASIAAGAEVIQWSGNDGDNQRWRFAAVEGGWLIVSALSENLVLDVCKASKADGADVVVWTPNGGRNQVWEFLPANPCVEPGVTVEEGYYRIVAEDGQTCVDISNESVAPGGNAALWAPNGGANQIFSITNEQGFIRIENGSTDLCISSTGADPVSGSNVTQQRRASNDAQLFSVEKHGEGYAFRNVANGLYLSVASYASGANIASGETAAVFLLEPVENLLGLGGVYEIAPQHAASMRLDVQSGSVAVGAPIIQWSPNGGFNQKWDLQLIDGSDNTYAIQSVNSGLYLADSDGKAVQSEGCANLACRWSPVPMSNGFALVNLATGRLLDIAGVSNKAGASACTWGSNGGSNQRFKFRSVPVVSNGVYEIRTDESQPERLGLNAASPSGASFAAPISGKSQQWMIWINPDGTFSIKNADAKRYLAVDGSGVLYTADSPYPWTITYQHDGTFNILSSSNGFSITSVESNADSQSSGIEPSCESDGLVLRRLPSYQLSADMNALQKKVVQAARSEPTTPSGYCSEWISNLFVRAGFPSHYYDDADDMYYMWCKSSNLNDLKIGMVVAVPYHPKSPGGRIYGHIGIYVGDGVLLDSSGAIRTWDVEKWIDYHNDWATAKWGWYDGKPLC